ALDAVALHAERFQQARCGIRIPLARQHDGAASARNDQARVGEAPGQDCRLHEAVAAVVKLIAAARKIDRPLKASTEHYDAGDVLRHLIGPGKAMLKRMKE